MTGSLADAASREKALDIGRSILVRAPAGSGKTELLTQRALACLAACRRPEEVLILTFTNKAVNEARERLLEALRLAGPAAASASPHKERTLVLARAVLSRDRELGWSLLDNPSRLRVMTIDKFNAEITTQLPVLSGFGGSAKIEDRPSRLYRMAIDNLFLDLEDETLDTSTRAGLEAVLAFAENQQSRLVPLLQSLLARRDQWLEVIHHADAFEMGTVVEQLISDRMVRADAIFPDRLRADLEAVLRRVAGRPGFEWARDLSQWCGRGEAALSIWREVAALLLTKEGTLRKKLTKTQGFPAGEEETVSINAVLSLLHADARGTDVASMLDEIRSLPDSHYPADLDAFRSAVTVVLRRLVAHLQLVFSQEGAVDFIEVSTRALVALGDGREITDALLRADNSLSHILLDEAQDTSASQYRLLGLLTAGWQRGDGRSLFIVGDGQQSIYSFRQAEVALFLRLWEEGQFGGLVLERVTLQSNFRSDVRVVDWFNQAFARLFPGEPDMYASVVTYSPSVATHSGAPEAGVTVHPFVDGDDAGEARQVAELAASALRAYPDDSVAILVRNRSHLREILPALKSAGIPFSCQDIDPLASAPAISDALQCALALWHPADREAWVGLLRAPMIGLSWADCLALVRGALAEPISRRLADPVVVEGLSPEGRNRVVRLNQALQSVLDNVDLAHDLPARVEALWYQLGGPACVTPSEAKDVQTFFGLLRNQCEGGSLVSLDGLLDAIRGLYASPEVGAVQVMTLHKAKGLEFDTVIMPRLGKGARRDDAPLLHHRSLPGGFLIAPHPGRRAEKGGASDRLFRYLGRLSSEAQHNEALRLLYVGVTRARKRLHLLGSASAPNGDRSAHATAGSLLSHLWPVVGDAFSSLPAPASDGSRRARVGVPLAPRLTLDWQLPRLESAYLPSVDHAELPSELAIHGARFEQLEDAASDADRIVGVLYHALMERIARDGLTGWSAERAQEQQAALMAGCRRLGMPEPMVGSAVERVIRLVRRSVGSDVGRWILGDHPDSACELALSGFLEDRWVSGVIDRVLTDESGDTWVIDYKTTSFPAEHQAALREAIVQYSPQLRRYSTLLREQRGVSRVRAGLYFPDIDRFEEVRMGMDSPRGEGVPLTMA